MPQQEAGLSGETPDLKPNPSLLPTARGENEGNPADFVYPRVSPAPAAPSESQPFGSSAGLSTGFLTACIVALRPLSGTRNLFC